MIFVTAFEFSILSALASGPKKTIQLSATMPNNHVLHHRLYYFVSQRWVDRIHDQYHLIVPMITFTIENIERVRKQRSSNKQTLQFYTDHIPDHIKNQIGVLCKAGVKRTEIAKNLGIAKADVLMVMAERDYRSKVLIYDEA
jgi:hypothetical protein